MKPFRLRNAWMFIFFICILMIFNTMGMSGCMKKNNTTKVRLNINTAALLYMQEKYGEKFEYYKPYGNSMSGTHSLLVRCASLPDQDILVSIENYRRENKVFLDNYLAVKYREETFEFLLDCARQVFGEANIFLYINYLALSPHLLANATFIEYLSDKRVPLTFDIEVKISNFSTNELIDQVVDLISIYGTQFYLRIVVVEDNDYGTFDYETFEEYIRRDKYTHCVVITRIDGFNQIRWLDED